MMGKRPLRGKKMDHMAKRTDLTQGSIMPQLARLCIPLLAAVTFGALPLMAGFACEHTFWKIGFIGGVVFGVTTWMFTAMMDRLLSGPKAKAAPVMGALCLYLAAQCFAGILL